jgi:hypothetical protein
MNIVLCDNPLADVDGCAFPWNKTGPFSDDWHPDSECAVNKHGLSPLQRAIVRGSAAEVKLLYVYFWADVNGNAHAEGTPLETAALFGEAEIIHFLVRCGARMCAQDGRCIPLEIAVCQGHRDAMLMLCALGAPRALWPADTDSEAVTDFIESWEAAHGPWTGAPERRDRRPNYGKKPRAAQAR